jgi:hypothetical protein
MAEKTPEALRGVLDRAIKLCDKYTPAMDRNPTPDGGRVRAIAVGILVAGRALVEALIEFDNAPEPEKPGDGK